MNTEERRNWSIDQLPEEQRDLLTSIERSHGRPIAIQLRTDPVSATYPNPNALACTVSADGAVIFFRSWNEFDVNSATHELLHLERYVVYRVPQLTPQAGQPDEHWKITSEIENSLEHLHVIPKEFDFGFDPIPYWTETYRQNWENFNFSAHPFAVKKNAFLGYLGLSLVNDAALNTTAHEVLQDAGLLEEADHFRDTIIENKTNKTEQLAYVCKSLGIPRKEVRLAKFFPATPQRLSPVPNSHLP